MKIAIQWTLALVALFLQSATSQAVQRNPAGLGQVLIYPYYNVTAGRQNLLSIVNHRNTGKALKLRLREARNGREVAAFNLYLGEFDVWTAALFTAPDGSPALLTQDNSCTVPAIQTSSTLPQLPDGRRYLRFSTADFVGTRADGGPTTIDRAATGYIELIEMGSLLQGSVSNKAATPVNGVPFDCPTLIAAWGESGPAYWRADATTDLQPPTGGMSGALTLLDVAEGTAHQVAAAAIDGFSIVPQHTDPLAPLPDLSSAVTETARQQVESIIAQPDGRLLRSLWPQQRAIDAVSAVLMQDRIRAEFNGEVEILARTEWVISLPTRRHYTDRALTNVPLPPFTRHFELQPGDGEYVLVRPNDREGRRPVSLVLFPGQMDPRLSCLTQATQALPFGQPLPAELQTGNCPRTPLPTRFGEAVFPSGFFELQLSGNGHRSRPALAGESYEGLPVLGFTMTRYRNTAARPGEIGIYGTTRPQSGTIRCLEADANTPCAGR